MRRLPLAGANAADADLARSVGAPLVHGAPVLFLFSVDEEPTLDFAVEVLAAASAASRAEGRVRVVLEGPESAPVPAALATWAAEVVRVPGGLPESKSMLATALRDAGPTMVIGTHLLPCITPSVTLAVLSTFGLYYSPKLHARRSVIDLVVDTPRPALARRFGAMLFG